MIAHRDLKPENILIHPKTLTIKLIDFGFAIKCDTTSKSSLTYCGTPSYMPPEIILKKEYLPLKSDIWSLGVVIYYVLTSELPFKPFKKSNNIRSSSIAKKEESNEKYLFDNIVNCRLDFSSSLSLDAIDLIRTLLNTNPMLRPNLEEISDHFFFINNY